MTHSNPDIQKIERQNEICLFHKEALFPAMDKVQLSAIRESFCPRA